MNKYKIIAVTSAIGTGLVATLSRVGATILPVPAYSDIVNNTTTSFGGSFLNDLLPWVGIFIAIALVGLAAKAVMGKVIGGLGRLFGGRRRGGRRGRR